MTDSPEQSCAEDLGVKALRRDLAFLVVSVCFVAVAPLFASSVFWTMHSDAASRIAWIVVVSSFFAQLVVVCGFAFSRSGNATELQRITDGIGLLLVIVLMPLVFQCLTKFWIVRPDSWDTLVWRLNDDWNQRRFHDVLRGSVCMLLVALVLWMWSHWRQVMLLPRNWGDAIRPKSRMSILQLMIVTTLVAGLAGVLLRSEWTPTVEDLIGLAPAIPLSLLAIASGYLLMHRKRGGWFVAICLGALTHFAIDYGIELYLQRLYSAGLGYGGGFEIKRFFYNSMISFGGYFATCLVAWLLLFIRGYRLFRRDEAAR